MRAIILAAGRGSRLKELTEERPKALTLLNGRPLIEWQAQSLKQAGIKDIAVVTGYLAHQLESYGTRCFHNARWSETNMVSSLWCAAEWLLEDVCIVSYGDIVYQPQVVKDLMSTKAEVAISYDPRWLGLWQKRFEDPLSDAETFCLDKKGCLMRIGGKPKALEEIEGQYMGLLRFEPTFWQKERFPEHDWDSLSMTAFLEMNIKKGVHVKAIKNEGLWAEVDSRKDLEVAEMLWR